MNINRKIKEIQQNPEVIGIGAVLALFGLLVLYKAGVLLGQLCYQLFN